MILTHFVRDFRRVVRFPRHFDCLDRPADFVANLLDQTYYQYHSHRRDFP